MFRKSAVTIIAVLVMALAIAFAACAQNQQGTAHPQAWDQPGMHGAGAPGAFASLGRILMPPGPRDLEKLGLAMNLTDAQKASIKELYKAFMTAMKQVAPTRAADLKAAVSLMQSGNAGKDALLSANAKIQQDDNAVLSAEFDFWTGLKGILNAQQQAAVQSFVQQRAQAEIGGGPRQGPHPQGTPKN